MTVTYDPLISSIQRIFVAPEALIRFIMQAIHFTFHKIRSTMNCTASSNNTSTKQNMQADAFFDFIDIMDDTELFDGVDPLFSFDVFESSGRTPYGMPLDSNGRRLSLTFARRLSITSVIQEDQKYQEGSIFPDRHTFHCCSPGREEDWCMPSMVPSSRSVTAINEQNKRPARKQKVSRPAILSLLTSDQLERQLEATKARLAESMERSAMSRKRLNHEVDCIPEDQYSRPRDSCKAQRSNSAPASVLSQSRARFSSYMHAGMKNISSRSL